MSFYYKIQKEMDSLKSNNLYRQTMTVTAPPAAWIVVNNQPLLNLASNNYLGLAHHPVLAEAATAAVEKYGAGSTGSRLVTGTLSLHVEVEEALAKFQCKDSALLFTSGYCANVGAIQALVGKNDTVFSDKLNHASIVDGITLSKTNFKRYRHRDLNHLEKLLKNTITKGHKLIITDSIFSMDGDRAPLKGLVELKQKYDALLMLDEAHGEGVFGPRGQGVATHEGLAPEVDIHMGTLSKAFGCLGAYVAGRKVLIDYLRNKCRSFIFTTSLPPAVLGSILGALKIIASDEGDKLREKLLSNSRWLTNELSKLGLTALAGGSQITPILIPGNENVLKFSNKLRQRGVLVLPVRHPTVPKNTERIRISLMATHTRQDLTYAVEQLASIIEEERFS